MKNKFLLPFTAAILISSISFSALATPPPAKNKVTIKDATIFLKGAELKSTARVSIAAGESDVLLTNIAGNVNQQSLIISADNNVVIQSATFQNNYLTDSAQSPQVRLLQDSLSSIKNTLERLADRQTVLSEQLNIIRQNRQVTGANTGLDVVSLQKLLDLVDVRMNALLAEQRKITDFVTDKRKLQSLINQQLSEEQKKGYQPGGQLLVKFYSKNATTAQVTLSYVVPNAGWRPSYDLRVEKVNAPVKLFYKAEAFQNSGVSWDKVNVTLSTGNPSEGIEAPELNPWRIGFYQPRPVAYKNRTNSMQLNRNVEVEAMAGGRSNLSDLSISSEYGYDESGGNPAPPMPRPDTRSLEEYTAVNTTGVSTTFEIELPYTIPSDGQAHTIAVKEYQLPATYRHFTVPKIDKDAFLQAQITNWEELNLIPASTNVFFEGSYVGKGYIDMRNVNDTLSLSLGRDKKIIVRREVDKDYQSERFIGSNESKSYGWTISVRNTRSEPITLVVLDQMPLSTNDDIKIENIKTGGAERNETTGSLKWNLVLKPAELKKLDFSYSVKFPKGKVIQNSN